MHCLLPVLFVLLLCSCGPSAQEAASYHDALVNWKQRVEQASAAARQDLYIGRGVADSATAFALFADQLVLIDSAMADVQARAFPGGDSLQHATLAFLRQRQHDFQHTLPEKFRTVYRYARTSRGRVLPQPEVEAFQARLNTLDAEMIRGTETARAAFRRAQATFAAEHGIALPEQQ